MMLRHFMTLTLLLIENVICWKVVPFTLPNHPVSQLIFQTTRKDVHDRMLEQPEEKEIPMEDQSAAEPDRCHTQQVC
jgi:hypothetical protein